MKLLELGRLSEDLLLGSHFCYELTSTWTATYRSDSFRQLKAPELCMLHHQTQSFESIGSLASTGLMKFKSLVRVDCNGGNVF